MAPLIDLDGLLGGEEPSDAPLGECDGRIPRPLSRWRREAKRRLDVLLRWRGARERPEWAPAIFGGWLSGQPYVSTGRVVISGPMFEVVRKDLLPRLELPRVLGYRARQRGIELVSEQQLRRLFPPGALFTEAELLEVADDVAVIRSAPLNRERLFDAVDLAMVLLCAREPVRYFLIPDPRAPLVVHDAQGRQSLVVPLQAG